MPRKFFPSGRSAVSILLVLLATLVLSASWQSARAQVLYGSLVGTVQDSTGAVIPAAEVTAVNTGTQQSLSTETTATGGFTFNNLFPGVYTLLVKAEGFRLHTEEQVAITANSVRRVDVTLQVGAVTENITVSAAALVLKTDKTDVSVELDQQVVANLPLPSYRNYQSLLNLVPGATPAQFQNAITDTPARALTTNVNGVNRNNNTTKVDGATNIFIWLPHHTVYVPPADTIEVVNIATNNFDAEQGMAGGAAINVMTKSGTNDFHGSAFAFHDNNRLRAKNFFNPADKPKSIRNIAGVTAGGPIVKNKLFYFGGWEGNRERFGFERLHTVPTAAQRAGDFSQLAGTIYDPLTGSVDGKGRTAFLNNQVPLSRRSSITRQMQDLVPMPNQAGVSANFFNSGTQGLNRDNFDVKVNYNRSDSHTIWGKYSVMDAQVNCAYGLGEAGGRGLCDGGPGVGDTLVQLSTLGHTWTLSPTFLWDATLGWTRMSQDMRDPSYGTNFGLDVLGIPGTNGPDIRQSGIPIFVIPGYESYGNPNTWMPAFRNDQTFTTTQNLSWMKGTHDLRFGFEGTRHHLNHWQPERGGGPRGQFTFNRGVTGLNGGPSLTQFNGYAAFLLGLPQVTGKSLQFEKMTAFEYQWAWYMRDRWQITPKLTATLGLRYELYPLMTRSGRGGIERWDPATNMVLLGGAGNTPKDVGVETNTGLFAPRVGLAYRVSDKMVVRSGYGITNNPLALARPFRGSFPLIIANDFPGINSYQPFRPIEEGIPEIVGPDVTQGAVLLPTVTEMRGPIGNKLHRGYVQSWNLVIERQLPGGFLASVGYVGTQTVRSFTMTDINAAPTGGGSAGRPFYAAYGRTGTTYLFDGNQSANYHGLQIEINRRAAQGLTLKGAYTYSKAINMSDDDGNTFFTFNTPSQFSRNRAVAGYHIPHMFQLGFVYELPCGPGRAFAQSGLSRWLFGDWQINGVFSAVQGRPFMVTAAGASLNAPGNSQTADQVKTEVTRVGSVGEFYDRAAFAPVNGLRFGTSGRNLLRGPGAVNLDFGVFRDFPIKEQLKLQFRAEAFNLSNTPHFNNPNSDATSSDFMRITSAVQDQRQFRFALRMSW
jgi:hypothetical protein